MSPQFHLEYFDPPPELSRHVLALFYFAWDEDDISDRHPGALPQIVLFPHGKGQMQFDDRVEPVQGEVHMLAGFEKAVPFTMEGPWHAIGASLSPLGWAALARQPANKHYNTLIPADELVGSDVNAFAKETNERYRTGDLTGAEACNVLADWIAPRFEPVPEEHVPIIEQGLYWLSSSLNPDIDVLVAGSPYSRRQTERLITRYFGLTPRALARKFRAIRAANLLAQPELTDEGEAEIAAAFYDQPHMIREIRRHCGYTPTRLGGPKEPLFQTLLRMKNLDRLKEFRSIGE
ncbi:helix-turn-helix domain-containing protein [Erythrobacter sp. F6033]|uniref:helix-turn-helix domain-containing protein n=1 Tax=Erythrobacter sp. F6033 TaxID=2926401 RepID=UPI001FF68069|nr:helix-turn-helix domain-containing protein [Erythrobacter sp. F6033]MCK0129704.1 helix-turn-helix domain-containing protein [Erythrobacter sp. F6033]